MLRANQIVGITSDFKVDMKRRVTYQPESHITRVQI